MYEYDIDGYAAEALSIANIKDTLIKAIKSLIEFLKRKLIDFGRQLGLVNRIMVTPEYGKAYKLLMEMNDPLTKQIGDPIMNILKSSDDKPSIVYEGIEHKIAEFSERISNIENEMKKNNTDNYTFEIDYRDIKKGLNEMSAIKNLLSIMEKTLGRLERNRSVRPLMQNFVKVLSKWSVLMSNILYAGKGRSIVTENYLFYDEGDIALEGSYLDLLKKTKNFNVVMYERKKKINALKKDKSHDHQNEIIKLYSENINVLRKLRSEIQGIEENLLTVSIVDGIVKVLSSLVNASSLAGAMIAWGGIGTAHIPKAVILAVTALTAGGQVALSTLGDKYKRKLTNPDAKYQSNMKTNLLKKIDNAITIEEYWMDLEKQGYGMS